MTLELVEMDAVEPSIVQDDEGLVKFCSAFAVHAFFIATSPVQLKLCSLTGPIDAEGLYHHWKTFKSGQKSA